MKLKTLIIAGGLVACSASAASLTVTLHEARPDGAGPSLVVNADGSATYPLLAPRLKTLSQVKAHALMIHAGGDNYADHPEKLGGGGARMACCVIAP